MGPADWLLLLSLSLLWGGSFFFAKVALADLPPLTLALGRVGLAALALALVARGSGQALPRTLGAWRELAVMGLLNNLVPFSLLFWAQTRITSGYASILNATTPLFTLALAHVLTRDERATPRRVAGLVLGVAGVALLVAPGALPGGHGHGGAEIACLGAALSYALAGIWGRRFAGVSPIVTAAGQTTMSALMLVPLALAYDRPWRLPPVAWTSWGALVGLALLSTALAYVIYFRLLASAGATNLLLVTLLIPVSAIALGAAILREPLVPRQLASMALIGVGLAAAGRRVNLTRQADQRPESAESTGSKSSTSRGCARSR